ncbi:MULTISPECIES: phage tail tape measure C-terminal domain-containing protein [unclassified Paracoccus (in: a-proteobacteria)]|uniref:phage tail tape measure C-terminal domain-containing protein n=1 Tax=unclassified Paracoccus (in: a-proteobacteria) TaxID=2688777 RepID=UPI0021E1849D|nr:MULTISPECIES: phage tail tape measure C-terminal domain-containing protein [unclassified Paracoccus (in: a-proteobacteria)]UXU75551.1 phage tail tape measure protein [Paracoccus sp. SMMA_5]UXU81455.1 phage tail tape measure protein [Paracoccus sp. SMMA_5_TC]
MAEKRVSVRLAAEGGRQVRAELEGVGEAGARGFGRLSREMEAANARLGAFSRRVRVAAAAAVAAAGAAGVAMIRSGLQTVDAQAKLAASLDTTVASIQVLERAGDLAGVSMGQVEQATVQLTRRLSQAASGTGPAVEALRRLRLSAEDLQRLPLDARIAAIQQALGQFVPEAERAKVAAQLFGDRASLVFTRIDTATLRQATEDVRDFGVVVSDQDAAQIERTNDAISRLGLIWRGISNQLAVAAAPALAAVANAMASVASRTGPLGIAIRGIFDNIGRLTTYAATFAAFLAGRWVAGMVAAALSVRGLATAFFVLRGALIRTGIGALIVGAGELVYQLSRLVARIGGVGEAFRLLGDLAREVWSRIGLSLDAALARMAAGWEGLKAAGFSALEGTIAGVVSFGDRTAAIFQGAYDAAVAIWGSLPGAIGDFAFQAANGLISGVEAMLNGVVTRINSFIESLNAALALLPEWATGKGGVRIGTLDPVELGRIGNPFEGAATAAGAAAADAFSAALSRTYLEPPDLGLGAMADDARARADGYREAAGMLADAAGRPLASWQALKDAVTGTGAGAETALATAAAAAGALGGELDETGGAAGRAGAAGRQAGSETAAGAEQAQTGWQAVTAALADYAARAREIGADIGEALAGAFGSAENAVVEFVRKGKLDFRDLVTSMIADLARLAARRFILGPIANALSRTLGGAGGIFANILHAGGTVGAPGPGRMVPALAFAGAPRMHSGGWAGLRPDEVPAILQRGERVLSRREAAGYGRAGAPIVNVTINARDADSFRQSRTQVAADIARAVSLGRRGM